MADTRSHEVTQSVAIDRKAESATAVLRDWDVHVTTILDDQGEVRVRAHDPRTLDAGVTMLRANAHRALAARHYLPAPVKPVMTTLPRRRAWQFAGVGALVGLLAAGGMIFRLATPEASRVQVVVMPAPTETVTVSEPPSLLPRVQVLGGAAGAPPAALPAPVALGTPSTGSGAGTPARTWSSPRPTTTVTRPPSADRSSAPVPTPAGTNGEPTSSPSPDARPPTSVTIFTRSPSSPRLGPSTCGTSASWTSSGCTSGPPRTGR